MLQSFLFITIGVIIFTGIAIGKPPIFNKSPTVPEQLRGLNFPIKDGQFDKFGTVEGDQSLSLAFRQHPEGSSSRCGAIRSKNSLTSKIFDQSETDWQLTVSLNLGRGEFLATPPDGVALGFTTSLPQDVESFTRLSKSGYWGVPIGKKLSGFGLIFDTKHSSVNAPGSIAFTVIGGVAVNVTNLDQAAVTCDYNEWEFQDQDQRSILKLTKTGSILKTVYGTCVVEYDASILAKSKDDFYFGIVGCNGNIATEHEVLNLQFTQIDPSSSNTDWLAEFEPTENGWLQETFAISSIVEANSNQLSNKSHYYDNDKPIFDAISSGETVKTSTFNPSSWNQSGFVSVRDNSTVLSGSSYTGGLLMSQEQSFSNETIWQVETKIKSWSNELIGIDGFNVGLASGDGDSFGVAVRFYHFFNYTQNQKIHIYAFSGQNWLKSWPDISLNDSSTANSNDSSSTIITECILQRPEEELVDYHQVRLTKIWQTLLVEFDGQCIFGISNAAQRLANMERIRLTISAWSGVSARFFELQSVKLNQIAEKQSTLLPLRPICCEIFGGYSINENALSLLLIGSLLSLVIFSGGLVLFTALACRAKRRQSGSWLGASSRKIWLSSSLADSTNYSQRTSMNTLSSFSAFSTIAGVTRRSSNSNYYDETLPFARNPAS